MVHKRKAVRLCSECYYDYKAGGIVFPKGTKVIGLKTNDVSKCDLSKEACKE